MRSRRLGPVAVLATILAAIMATPSMLQPTAAAPLAATEAQPAAAPVTVKVMSFNIWLGGTQVSFGQVVRAVQTAGADIVGVQEPGANLARLATELGWYHHAGQNVVSRYPLVDPGDGGPYVYAAVAPGQAVAVSNVHLTAYPYGPYDLRDGTSLSTVLANEQRIHMSEMASRFQALPAVAASGVPVFLTGDFNVPSHLDWTEARRPEHFGYAVRWPVSDELERLGFRDPHRQVHPDPSADHGHTWTPGYPPPNTDPDEVHDRIDFVYAIGPSTTTASQVVGESSANADIVVSPWPSDHRAVLATFTATPAPALGRHRPRRLRAGRPDQGRLRRARQLPRLDRDLPRGRHSRQRRLAVLEVRRWLADAGRSGRQRLGDLRRRVAWRGGRQLAAAARQLQGAPARERRPPDPGIRLVPGAHGRPGADGDDGEVDVPLG